VLEIIASKSRELIDAFCAYFDNYEISRRLENQLLRIIEDGIPYDSVRGEIWLTLARIASPRLMEKPFRKHVCNCHTASQVSSCKVEYLHFC
jgi:hypothetical protein